MVMLLTSGCGEDSGSSQGGNKPEAYQPVGDVYEVRGRIASLPDKPSGTQLFITHERIDVFRNREGEIVGMEKMTMPFPVAESIDLQGFSKDEPVRFKFDVDWASNTFTLFEIEKLPADVELDL
jgi:hypothetical protein